MAKVPMLFLISLPHNEALQLFFFFFESFWGFGYSVRMGQNNLEPYNAKYAKKKDLGQQH